MISLDLATEIFVRGFSFTRSFTYPCIADRLQDGVWVVRDAERKRGEYRTEEYAGHGVDAATLDAVARRHTRGHYRICPIRSMDESDAAWRADFKAMGYRLNTTEALMVHSLDHIDDVVSPVPIQRVTTPEPAEALAKAARRRQILPEHLALEPPPMRQYMALDGDQPVGWVGSVHVGDCGWCTNMFVAPPYRRRGIARALVCRMLQDERAAGLAANVLLASHAGSKLYPTVGYRQIGELLVYTPPRG